MASLRDEWTPHQDYIAPDFTSLDNLNPIIHQNLIEERTQELNQRAISKFRITKLPVGTPDEHKQFVPIAYSQGPTRGMQRKKTQQELQEEAKRDLLKKEEKAIREPVET